MRSILSARIAVCQCRPGASLQITSGHVPPQIFILFDDDYYHGLNYNYFASEG